MGRVFPMPTITTAAVVALALAARDGVPDINLKSPNAPLPLTGLLDPAFDQLRLPWNGGISSASLRPSLDVFSDVFSPFSAATNRASVGGVVYGLRMKKDELEKLLGMPGSSWKYD